LNIGFAGCGLIGSSIALLAERYLTDVSMHIFEPNSEYRKKIKKILPNTIFVEDVVDLVKSDFVFVCTPPSKIFDAIDRMVLAEGDDDEFIIVDVGSVKSTIVDQVKSKHPGFKRFVPGHPFAGAVSSGPYDADLNVLHGAPYIITPYDGVSHEAIESVQLLLEKLKFDVYKIDAGAHDKIVACTSHGLHLFSMVLTERYLEIAKTELNETGADEFHEALGYMGGSFLSMTKYAMSDSKMWADIFKENHKSIKLECQILMSELNKFIDWMECSGEDDIILRLNSLKNQRLTMGAKKNEDN